MFPIAFAFWRMPDAEVWLLMFGIRSIPSILFVPMNDRPQMAAGALPKESFVQAINEILLPADVAAET